ncbi:MAG: FkbM family methyltransferase [Acidobacteria bacterium]|nr:MAG: FkbM family methyltransferase [Acidobacteriota bacterium]
MRPPLSKAWLRLLAATAVRQRSRHRLYRFRFRPAPAGALRVHITPRFGSDRAGATVTLRPSTSDRRVFEQIFLDDEYDLRSLARWPELDAAARAEPSALILDLGANIGLAALALHFQLPTARILAVEPDPANFAQLQRNTAALPAISPLHAAVAAHDGWAHIANPGAATAGLRTEPAAPGAAGAIPARSIASLCAGAAPLLVKMDIEGAERDLFSADGGSSEEPGAPAGGPCRESKPALPATNGSDQGKKWRATAAWLASTRLLIVEPHDWAFPGQALSQPLLAALAARAGDVVVRGEHLFCWR